MSNIKDKGKYVLKHSLSFYVCMTQIDSKFISYTQEYQRGNVYSEVNNTAIIIILSSVTIVTDAINSDMPYCSHFSISLLQNDGLMCIFWIKLGRLSGCLDLNLLPNRLMVYRLDHRGRGHLFWKDVCAN